MVMFGLPNNEAGALHAVLGVLAENNINMSKIESRPSKNGVWDYLFFADLLGHAADTAMIDSLRKIKENASIFKVLGSFPRGDD
jgi:chorismate mutase/prephenate dehydratase